MLFLFSNQETLLAKGPPPLLLKWQGKKHSTLEVFACLAAWPGGFAAQISRLLSQGTADKNLLKGMMSTKKHTEVP